MPGGQLPLVAAGLAATLLPPPLEQADMAEPSTMVAQMAIAAGTLVMMLASPLLQQPTPIASGSHCPSSPTSRCQPRIASLLA
jgi:hypothetical protein